VSPADLTADVQRELKALLDSAVDAVIVIDATGTVSARA